MILKARHHFIIHPFFKAYTLWKMSRHFSRVELTNSLPISDKPVLLLSNHTSWWDGFWVMWVNLKVLRRKFHFMMLEDQLRKHWFFNHTGGFSVSKNHRSLLETLAYTRELLSDPQHMVLMFPQGSIQSVHEHEIRFQKGVERILADRFDKVQVVFQVNLTDYFSQEKPSLWIGLQEYRGESFRLNDINAAYQAFFDTCLAAQKRRAE